jgi:pimeloyl-ACP methyl ester carboxylesterase
MQIIESKDGTTLAVYESGRAEGMPLFLIHGFSQAAMCWRRQTESALADEFRVVSLDVRGHGASGKPGVAGAYDNSRSFADDFESVLDALDIESAVLVGWSMGGNWICDYLRHYGEGRVRGIFLAGATTQQGTDISQEMFGATVGESLGGMFEPDPQTNIAATQAFLRACTAAPLPPEEFSDFLGFNMLTPPEIRQWVLNRVADNSDIVAKITVPVTQVHGSNDGIVLPFAGEYTVQGISHDRGELILYDDTGHCAFWERADRFNADLAAFAQGI